MAVTHQWKWMAGQRLVAKFDAEAAAAGDTYAPVILTSNTAGAPTQGAELLGVAIPDYAASETGVPVIISEDIFEVTLASGNNPGLGDPVTIATTGEVTAWAEGSGDAVCGHVVDYDPASGGLCKIKAQFDALRYLTGLLEVDTEQLAADCVTSAKIADGAVDSEHIADGAIDLAHMSANSVDSDQYVDGSIDLAHMSANSVDSDQYVDGSIDNEHLAANSVDSDNYIDASIDPEHLAATVTYKVALQDFVRGDFTAAPRTRVIGFGIGAGVIVKAGFSLQNTGADGTDPLDLEMDVKVGATSIFTTKPKLEDDAADGSDTFTAGTGITVGVIDTTKDDVAANDRISIEWTLTRTTPGDEMADLFAEVVVAYKAGV